MKKVIKSFLDFYKKSEKLKTVTRHSWLSNTVRQESTAEHSWMLVLMAMVFSDQLKKKINLFKVMKMLTIHDLAEAVTGDIPSHEVSVRNIKANKYKAEQKALKAIVKGLPQKNAKEIIDLWEEMEAHKTYEAIFAHALDKVEVVLQHNLADISTFDQGDYNASPYYRNELFDFDPFMRSFRDVVTKDGMEKILKAKTEHRLPPGHLERYKESKKSKKK